MKLPSHKTKIVCTIGPACLAVPMIEEMLKNGMSVARINFSHGEPSEKLEAIRNVREAARRTGRYVSILADLPGTKIRIGKIKNEPLMLKKGDPITLTVKETPEHPEYVPVEYKQLPESVKPGGTIYLNDGFLELRVESIEGPDVHCSVVVGGALLSRKGLNMPGAKIYVDPVTPRDLQIVEFALKEGVDTFGISFVEKADDILKVKEHARKLGKEIYAIAKIERVEAIKNFEEILNVADGVMVARGDLGVEMPIEDVPSIQKKLISKCNLFGRPVITATQMLESMKSNTRPTRAEVSDVANAILDGTDCIMLSEETALGKYPVETVKMMSAIAVSAERQRTNNGSPGELRWYLKTLAGQGKLTIPDVISRNVVVAADVLRTRYILTPTDTGSTARRISRYKPDCWILSFSSHEEACRFMSLSYGVYPFLMSPNGAGWHGSILKLLDEQGLVKKDDKVIFTEGRFLNMPGGTDSMGILTIGQEGQQIK